MSLLEMRGISKRFGATQALEDVNLTVERGEVHALLGENGSGKSTLMRVLAGVISPDTGEMTLDGQPYRPKGPLDARRSGIAMIHQELSLAPDLTVAENVLLGREDAKGGIIRRSETRRRAQEALARLGYPDLDVDALVRTLPIAIRQVVEIARAIALGSQVVVLDEPTSSLTGHDAERLFEVVDVLRREGHGVIYISHFLDEIRRLGDRLTVLRDGRSVATHPVAETPNEAMVSLMVGRDIEDLYPRGDRTPGEVLIEVENLSGGKLPKDASLTLHRGEVLGIAGLNGSGRTELLRIIFGLDPVRSGRIKVQASEGFAPPAKRWGQGLGLLSEDRKIEGLALTMSIADNITLTTLDRMGKRGTISDARQMEAGKMWIERLRVRCQGPHQPVGELSGGNQQKVALARLMQHGVDVLLLDEPTRGIDVGSKEQIYRLIDDAAREGKAVLMVSSYLPELLGVCDRIAVMSRGTLGAAVPARETNSELLMHEAVGA
ncbi:MAG: sugar ABC transporter ATP-binding protein [Fimbriimonas sp.]